MTDWFPNNLSLAYSIIEVIYTSSSIVFDYLDNFKLSFLGSSFLVFTNLPDIALSIN